MTLFDIEICLPVFQQAKWRARLEAFRRQGLLNTSGVRTRLVLLAGIQRDAGLGLGWPVDDVCVLPASMDDAAGKIYSYYSNLSLADIGRARWFLRVDDNSSTDVSGLVHSLDQSYLWREPHHLMARTSQSTHLSDPLPQWLQELGCGHVISKHFAHDREVSATSQSAMLRALADPRCREILRRASTLEGHRGDLGLAVCCRVAGISPAPTSFLEADPAWWDYGPFGGEKHHIHGVAPDQSEHWAPFQERLAQHLADRVPVVASTPGEAPPREATIEEATPAGRPTPVVGAPSSPGEASRAEQPEAQQRQSDPGSTEALFVPDVLHRLWSRSRNKPPVIPKLFHMIWLGSNPPPKLALRCRDSWLKHHPGWKLKW